MPVPPQCSHAPEVFRSCCAAAFAGRYADYVDELRFDDIVGFFAEDAVFEATAFNGAVLRGREEIRQFYVDAPRALGHFATGAYVVASDDTTATVRMRMLVVFRKSLSAVAYEWTFIRDPRGWSIGRQAISLAATNQFVAQPAK
jgi:ketosteroid isomerase-like protein